MALAQHHGVPTRLLVHDGRRVTSMRGGSRLRTRPDVTDVTGARPHVERPVQYMM